MSLIAYSQNTYPRTIVIGKDTVVAITRQQQRDILKLFWQVDELKAEICIKDEGAGIDSIRISELQAIIVRYENLIADFKLRTEKLETATTLLEAQIKLWKRKYRLTKVKGIVGGVTSGVGGAAIGFIVGFFITKNN